MNSRRIQNWMLAGLAIGLAVAAGPAMALGLGEARVSSYLNQPLEVEIRLVEATAEELDSLTVRPGSVADYERVGLDSGVLQARLEATLDRSTSPPVIRLVSQSPINDPVLQVLVHARWASGRVLREYTLFLDPPTMDARPPAATRQPGETVERETRPAPREPAEPRRQPPAREPEPEPTDAESPARPEPEATTQPRASEASYRTVQAGDTMWSIAQNWRQDPGLNMAQVMLAFLEANPEAFVDGNVNRMLRGAELNAPSEADVRAIEIRRAEQEIQAQMAAWQALDGSDLPVVSDAAVAAREPEPEPGQDDLLPDPDPVPEEEASPTRAPTAEPTEEVAEVDHRLELVPPEDDAPAEGAAEGDLESDDEVRRLRAALARTEEDLFTFQLENEELNRQVDALRDALDARDQGFAVSDTELAELESRLREARLAAVEESVGASDSEVDPVAEYFRELEGGLGLDDDAGDETDEGLAALPDEPMGEDVAGLEEEPVTGEEAAPATTADDPGLRGMGYWLRQPLVWLVAGGLLLLLFLGGLFLTRRRARARSDAEGRIDHEEPPRRPLPVEPETVEDHGTGQDGTMDMVEAQRREIAADPASLTSHLMLLRLLADRDEPREFGRALDEMYAQVQDDDEVEWQEALALARIHAPEHPLVAPDHDRAAGSEPRADDEPDDLMRILNEPDEDELEEPISQEDLPREEPEIRREPESVSSEVPEDEEEDFLSDFDLGEFADELPDEADKSAAADLELTDAAEPVQPDLVDPGAEGAEGDTPLSGEPQPATGEAEEDDEGLEFDLEGFDLHDLDNLETQDATEAGADSGKDWSEEEGLAFDTDSSALLSDNDAANADLPADVPEDDVPEDDDMDLVDLALGEDLSGPEPAIAEGEDKDPRSPVDPETDESGDDGDLSFDMDLEDLREDSGQPADGGADVEEEDTFSLGEDESEVKLDLARAYVSMGDKEAARTILEEVLNEGADEQKAAARKLLDGM